MVGFAVLFALTYISFCICASLKAIHFSWLGLELLVCCLPDWVSTGVFFLLQIFSDVVRRQGLSIFRQFFVSVSPRF